MKKLRREKEKKIFSKLSNEFYFILFFVFLAFISFISIVSFILFVFVLRGVFYG